MPTGSICFDVRYRMNDLSVLRSDRTRIPWNRVSCTLFRDSTTATSSVQALETVKRGKNPYFAKKSDLRTAELKGKFERLKKEGKVDKYLAKRRKKNLQKDKKSLWAARDVFSGIRDPLNVRYLIRGRLWYGLGTMCWSYWSIDDFRRLSFDSRLGLLL